VPPPDVLDQASVDAVRQRSSYTLVSTTPRISWRITFCARRPTGVDLPVASALVNGCMPDIATVTSRPGQPSLCAALETGWNATANRLQAAGHRPEVGGRVGVPDRVKGTFPSSQVSGGRPADLSPVWFDRRRKAADDAVADALLQQPIQRPQLSSPGMRMIQPSLAPGQATGVSALPSRTTLLERSHARVVAAIKPSRRRRTRTGSLASDGWTDTAGRPLVSSCGARQFVHRYH
jgi:hypothetical protein